MSSREDFRNRLDPEARLPGLERQRVPGERGRDDGKRVARIAAVARRIGQHRDQLQELDDRARPAVREEERHRRRPLPFLVDEMQLDPAERHLELAEGVEPRLLRPPVEAGAPVVDELLQIGDARAGRPRLERWLVG